MATQAKVHSVSTPAWAGHQSSPIVSANMVINVRSDRSKESLEARLKRIQFFVENDHEPE